VNFLNVLITKMSEGGPVDGGPVYAETNLHYLIAEPWNAISSLAFIIPVIYWGIRLKGRYKEYPFLTLCLPLLFAGGIGSTLFHAFRYSKYLLWMDVLPIAILTLLVGIYFWYKILPKTWMVAVVVIVSITIRALLFKRWLFTLDGHMAVNVAYFINGFMIFLPGLVLLIKSKFLGGWHLVIACLVFIVSLTFRQIDNIQPPLLPMGTHWLWHVTGAVGSWLLGNYLYIINDLTFKKQPKKEVYS
jgi:hypothetical protein